MDKRIVFRGMPCSIPIEEHANKHLARIEDFLLKENRTPMKIDLVMSDGKTHAHYKVELHVKTPEYDVFSHYEGPDFYQTLDHVIEVAYRELHNAKDRRIEDRKTVGRHDEFKKQR